MKTYQLVSIFFVLLLITLHGYGQERVNIERYESLANEHLYDEEYDAALELFLALDSAAPNTSDYLYKVGFCYLQTGLKTEALAFIKRAEELGGVDDEESSYYLGKSYHLNHQFDKAIQAFKDYKEEGSDSTFRANSELFIEQCNVGKKLYADSLEIIVTHLDRGINTVYPEYVPLVSEDDSILIFTSRRENTTGGRRELGTNQFFEDIYISLKESDGSWGTPKSIGENINTEEHDACAGLSHDGKKLIIYKEKSRGASIAGDLYLSEIGADGVWSIPQKLGKNINTKGWEPSACFSPDNRTLYFVSNRKGGQGGADIYRSELSTDGVWGPAENLGEKINTYYDEDSPYMHPDGKTLFFSSKGHENMGGYDIFYTTYNEKKKVWSEPKNLGYPINTADDDIYFVWSSDGTKGYYSSSMADSYGDKDLYMLTRPVKSEDIICRITLKDSLSGQLLERATVSILALPNQDIITRKVLVGGRFVKGVPQGKRYKYVVEAEGYLLREGEFDAPVETAYYEIHKELKMKNFSKPVVNNDSESNDSTDGSSVNNDSESNDSTDGSFVNNDSESNDSTDGSSVNNDSESNDSTDDSSVNNDLESNDSTDGSFVNNDSESNDSTDDSSANNGSESNDSTDGSFVNNDSESNDSTDGSFVNNDSESNDSTDGSSANNDSKNNSSAPARANNNNNNQITKVRTNEIFEEGSKIIYRKILFDHDKSDLRSSSVQELDKFHNLMRSHPTLKVEVAGHTDEVGSKWYNKRLSKKRAKVVVKYLIDKGINKKRIVAAGYGERKPFASNSTAAGRQLNRRTEIKVIKFIDENKYQDDKIDLNDIENWKGNDVAASTPGSTSIVTSNPPAGNMLPTKVHFMFNVYDKISPYSEEKLNEIVQKLNQNSSMRLRIHAHTDTQGDTQYNQKLSTLRAKTVMNYLISKGISPSRLEVASHGDQHPFIEIQDNQGGHLHNRRVEFEVIQE